MIDLDALRADADFDGYAARMSIGELDALIAELRAARKVVEAARALIGRIDGQPRSRLEVEPFHRLVDALAELEGLK